MKREELAKKTWNDWENVLSYQRSLNLKDICETCTNFLEGRQWAQATERTKNLPRPVINIIKYIVNNKKSNVLSSKIKMIYKPLAYDSMDADLAVDGATQFTNFAGHINKQIKQEDLNDKAIKDGLVKGTYIFHYFWDKQAKTGMARYDGGLNGQIIDPLNIGFANPKEKDEQKQKWIIICGRENTQTIKEIAKKNGLSNTEIELIKADDDTERNYNVQEQDGEEYTTVLTKYFRKNGEVYYIKTTKNIVIQDETPLTPDAEKIKLEIDEEGKTNEDLEDANPDKPDMKFFKMSLYPIVVGFWEEREKSIYGIGEVEQLLPTQKAVNFNYAMMLMSTQNVGFPKVAIRPRALQGKQLTNQPGEVVVDYSPNFDGIRYLNPPASNIVPITLTDKMIELTRTVTGATEVTNGEAIGANMAASAIVALQSQAKVPIEDIQKRFWRIHEKIARIWEQFFKAYYTFSTDYLIEKEGNEVSESFNGGEYQNIDFETSIDVGPGSAYSESMSISLLENALNRGNIDFDEFIELYPDSAMPFKAKLKELRNKKLLPADVSRFIMQNPQLYQMVMEMVGQAQVEAKQPTTL